MYHSWKQYRWTILEKAPRSIITCVPYALEVTLLAQRKPRPTLEFSFAAKGPTEADHGGRYSKAQLINTAVSERGGLGFL